MMSMFDIAKIRAWWFRGAVTENRPQLTGFLVSGDTVEPVYGGDVTGTFEKMMDVSWGVGLYDTTEYRAPTREATYYSLVKGETLTRVCSVTVTP